MALIIQGLTHSYGNTPALTGLTLRVGPGITAVLGPNGSGKSTLLKLIATAIRPGNGEILLGSLAYTGDLRPIRRALGYLPQELELPPHLTPRSLLHYLAGLKGVPAEPQSSRLLEDLGLLDRADRPMRELSAGQVRRVGLAQALLGSPRLLVLDEPTRGLDPQERERALRLLARSTAGRITLFSSHLTSEIESLCRQVVVLREGRPLFAGPVDDLRTWAAGGVFETTVPAADAERFIQTGLISRVLTRGDESRLRFVGTVPQGLKAAAVEPDLEEGYLLLLHSNRMEPFSS